MGIYNDSGASWQCGIGTQGMGSWLWWGGDLPDLGLDSEILSQDYPHPHPDSRPKGLLWADDTEIHKADFKSI